MRLFKKKLTWEINIQHPSIKQFNYITLFHVLQKNIVKTRESIGAIVVSKFNNVDKLKNNLLLEKLVVCGIKFE
jgi:hypothetical protein